MIIKGERIFFPVLIVLAALLYIYAGLTLKGESDAGLYINIYFIAHLPLLAAILFFRNHSADFSTILVISGLLFRAFLLFTEPVTSDDHYRYLWEGKMILAGENPYQIPPNDSRLDKLHEENLPSKVAFPSYTTIYPPLAQAVFAAGYLISGDSTLGLKLLLLFFEFGSMFILLRLLKLFKRSPNYIVLYAWLPLVLFESFVNIHIDPFALFFFLLFLLFLSQKDNTVFTGILAGVTCSFKPYAVFAFPLILRKRGLRQTVIIGLTALAVAALVYIPFLNTERSIFDSFSKYMGKWQFNASVYRILTELINSSIARTVVLVSLAGSLLVIAFRYKNLPRAVAFCFILAIIFGPTNYPWYMIWLAGVSVLYPLGAVYWMFYALNFTNFTPMGRVWIEYDWAIFAEYSLFYALLFYGFIKKKDILLKFKEKDTD